MFAAGTWHLTGGFEPERVADSGHPSLVPFQLFEAADGWLVVGCAKEKFWRRLTEVLGRPDPHTQARGLVAGTEHPHYGTVW